MLGEEYNWVHYIILSSYMFKFFSKKKVNKELETRIFLAKDMNKGPKTRKQLMSCKAWVIRTVLQVWPQTSSTRNWLEMQTNIKPQTYQSETMGMGPRNLF